MPVCRKRQKVIFFEHYYITKFLMKYYIIPNRTAPIASNLSRSNWSAIRFLYSINELFANVLHLFVFQVLSLFYLAIWRITFSPYSACCGKRISPCQSLRKVCLRGCCDYSALNIYEISAKVFTFAEIYCRVKRM